MIEFKNVYYKSGITSGSFDILKKINVKIENGSFLCVIGKNGSGKTTFGKLIKGLITPTAGDVIINKKSNTGTNNSVGYIFTNPENQIVHPIVEDDIAFGLENLLLAEDEIMDRVYIALNEVKMEEHLKTQVSALSKGEQQKIVAAGVIALNYDIVIFDEATAMLDKSARDEFMKIVLKLHNIDKKTIIFITHNLEDVMYADNVLLLDCGHVAFHGTKKEFFENEALKEEYDFAFPDIVDLVNYYNRKGYNLNYNDIPSIAKSIHNNIKDKLH